MAQPAQVGVSEELLDEALEESFPASDPLSFWSGQDPMARPTERRSPPPDPAAGPAE